MPATGFKDYYAVLGVDKSVEHEQIKKAYRKLARQYHPDLNPGDQAAEVRFKEINEAYEVLSDPQNREKYDQYGQYWKQAAEGGAPPAGAYEGAGFEQYGNFDSFVDAMLGGFGNRPSSGQRRSRTQNPGSFQGFEDFTGERTRASASDIEGTLSLDFSEALRGTQKQLQVGEESMAVRIPAGAKAGSRIRVRGKGRPRRAGERGDLYLTLEVQPHSYFQLEGDDIVCEVPIAPDEAVLGAQIQVPTLEGPVTLTVPPGVRSGQSLRLKGKGWPRANGSHGDQRVKLQVITPKESSPQERELYQQIRQLRSFDPRAQLKDIRL